MDSEVNGFTCCVLTYGDHIDLVKRCLGSIMNEIDSRLVPDVRVGMNAASDRVRDYVYERLTTKPPEVRTLVYDSRVNRGKYPVMRRMFYDDAHPIVTPFLQWFDDDSYVTGGREWWSQVYRKMETADMIGSIYRLPIRSNQAKAIIWQPWYTGQQIYPGYRFRFATGGWWCAKTRIIHANDYPFMDLHHNGGDSLLGEMIRQQGYKLVQFNDGVCINADEAGRESKAPRRGISQPPLWTNYDPKQPVDHSHHQFELRGVVPQAFAVRTPVAAAITPFRRSVVKLPGLA